MPTIAEQTIDILERNDEPYLYISAGAVAATVIMRSSMFDDLVMHSGGEGLANLMAQVTDVVRVWQRLRPLLSASR